MVLLLVLLSDRNTSVNGFVWNAVITTKIFGLVMRRARRLIIQRILCLRSLFCVWRQQAHDTVDVHDDKYLVPVRTVLYVL